MKVSFIDDDALGIFVTKNILELEGITQDISIFQTAADALEAVRTSSKKKLPDVLLLDLNMPLVDGWGFLEEITLLEQKFKNKFNIHALTSSVIKSDRVKMKEYPHVLNMIHKPISSEDIQVMFFSYSTPDLTY